MKFGTIYKETKKEVKIKEEKEKGVIMSFYHDKMTCHLSCHLSCYFIISSWESKGNILSYSQNT